MKGVTTPASRQGNIAAIHRFLNGRLDPNNSELTTVEKSRPDQNGSAATASACGARWREGIKHSPA
jgi:hypothetical protein